MVKLIKYYAYSSVFGVLGDPGLRPVTMRYKVVIGLVAIPVHLYFGQPRN